MFAVLLMFGLLILFGVCLHSVEAQFGTSAGCGLLALVAVCFVGLLVVYLRGSLGWW